MNLYLNHSYNTFRKPINKKIWVKSWTLRSEQQSNTIDISNVVQVLPVVIKVFVILHSGLLVLLVLGDEVVHVGLGLSELHLVHALPGVPVEEGLPPEHGSELLGDPLEQFLDRGGVSDEG